MTPFLFTARSGLLTALLLVGCSRESSPPASALKTAPRLNAWVQEREEKLDQTIWAKEILAEKCGRVIESLWDQVNAATNKLEVAARFAVGEVRLGQCDVRQDLPHGVQVFTSTNAGPVLRSADWRALLETSQRDGWRLSHTEFRHRRFDVDASGRPRQSSFYFSAHLTNALRADRVAMEGDLVVDWGSGSTGAPSAVQSIDTTHLILKRRQGPPPFQPLFEDTLSPPDKASWIDPLIVQDLDGDGIPEIILLAANRVYRRGADGSYRPEPLLGNPPGLIFSGGVADFDGDGFSDVLCVVASGLVLFHGSDTGTFNEPGEPVWQANPLLINPMAVTCGDIDGDGDLDLFLAQYRVPTLGQIFRPSYYDANDGHPAYLLLNDGRGHFTNATAAAGLDKKRGRRVFSASFVDLDDDGHLDLVVVSDFAGLDLYRNDGTGRFIDVTSLWVAEPHAFGMSQLAADFNRDGRLDFLMIGMNSPTVDRLEHLGLTRSGSPDESAMRRVMTFGSRLYLARRDGGFEQTAMSDSIARSGWAWGGAAFDWDNDGYPDVYISNGQDTRSTVQEYEPLVWLHNFYITDPDDGAVSKYLMDEFERTRSQGWSYGGYEKNRLYWNQAGLAFTEIAHLLGVALEEDSRGVVSTDLDGDGRMDLLVLTLDRWPGKHQTLRVYKNTLADGGNWIGLQLRDAPGHPSTGARITVRCGDRKARRQSVTGDSFRSQQSSLIHFGLGGVEQVDQIEIQWPDGKLVNMQHPAINRYYRLSWPGASKDGR